MKYLFKFHDLFDVEISGMGKVLIKVVTYVQVCALLSLSHINAFPNAKCIHLHAQHTHSNHKQKL